MPASPPALPLRDIHLPEAIGWWPLAPGWWALVVLIPLSTWLLARWLRRRAHDPRRLALYQLTELERNPALSPADKAKAVSILLRRAAMSAYGRPDAARLAGEEWLEFLDRALDDNAFREGAGRVLLEAPFRPDFDGDLAPLFDLCRRWFKRLPRRKT